MEHRIPLMSLEEEQSLFGPHDRYVKQVARRHQVRMSSRGGTLRLKGPQEEIDIVHVRVDQILELLRSGRELESSEIEAMLFDEDMDVKVAVSKKGVDGHQKSDQRGGVRASGKWPTARTEAQQRYLDLLRTKDLVFSSGPAGTGKTYLAVAAAVRSLREGSSKRLVLTRPAVEAGEHLGFLPGDLEDKIDPYLRPLFDALNDLMSPAATRRMRELDIIEVAPLAFMRGRTFNDSFVILDEAQNATRVQMKMFLTRLGERTKAVVTGDVSQTDLPGSKSGLKDAIRRLGSIEGVGAVEFAAQDVQRSSLVARIVRAYES
jgi:phosphate starvation-inducible PhoH-like protein|tara:strand:+ start:1333 stop:2289 length:957 start_codon:yes stop_codon:yes gene_type:complete